MLLYNIINERSGGVVNYIKYKANKYEYNDTFTVRGSQQSISLESQISVQLKLT